MTGVIGKKKPWKTSQVIMPPTVVGKRTLIPLIHEWERLSSKSTKNQSNI
jgi:hypothetical protein